MLKRSTLDRLTRLELLQGAADHKQAVLRPARPQPPKLLHAETVQRNSQPRQFHLLGFDGLADRRLQEPLTGEFDLPVTRLKRGLRHKRCRRPEVGAVDLTHDHSRQALSAKLEQIQSRLSEQLNRLVMVEV